MSGPKRGSIAASVVVVLVFGAFGIARVVNKAGGGCGTSAVTLNVSAAPDIAPSVAAIAQQWQQTDPTINGGCVRVAVSAVAPAEVATELAAPDGGLSAPALPSTPGKAAPAPAVWIPDSTAWVTRVQGANLPEFGAGSQPSLAYSPVVLGIEQADAAKLRMKNGTISAKDFKTDLAEMRVADAEQTADVFQLGLAEPRNDAAGLAAAATLAGIDVGTSKSQGGPYANIVADYRIASPNAETAIDGPSLLKAFTVPNTSFKGHASPQMTVAMVSEQSILAYAATHPAKPLTAIQSGIPIPGLDYPIALVAGVSAPVAQAAAMFQTELLKPAHQGVLAANGFRAPSGAAVAGFPASSGATTTAVTPNPIKITSAADDRYVGALALWSAANTQSRVLVLTSISSSMDMPSRFPGASRLQLTQAAATAGLRLFTDDSELGNWAFAPGLGKSDYRELVPVKELDKGNQATAIKDALGTVTTVPQGGCGLYPAVDAAYQSMLDDHNYEPTKINTIVIFTDCSAPDPNGISATALLAKLTQLHNQNADKTVPFVLINVGPRTNDPTLDKISSALGGGPAQDLNSPADIVSVFLQAVVSVGN